MPVPQGSFAPYPGAGPSATLFVEAFGQLVRETHHPGIISDEEDLYSVFRARAELMGWSATGTRGRPLLWGMNDAGLTAGSGTSRIGWVQVGLEAGVEATVALPALIQCFDDALRRFGTVELSGLQVTATDLAASAGPSAGDLISALNWFNIAPETGADALILIDGESLAVRAEADIAAGLQQLNTGPFVFGSPVAVPGERAIEAPDIRVPAAYRGPSGLGLPVVLPEWTASAAAWPLTIVIGAMRSSQPDVRNLTVRLTRSR